jgi:hypothetical protein
MRVAREKIIAQMMPQIQIQNIELYCDGNHPRGISVIYRIDQKVIPVYNIKKICDSEKFKRKAIQLEPNETITQIDIWKNRGIL